MNMQVDLTPTWGEIGNIVKSFALSGERQALQKLWPEAARAFASAEALQAVMPLLSDEQTKVVATTLTHALGKQGY